MIEESAKSKISARDTARLERQRKLAEALRTKADAEDRGEDVERQKNWEWTIEENEAWEEKKARKARRADFEFHGALSCFVKWGLQSLYNMVQTMHMLPGDDTRKTWTKFSLTWRLTIVKRPLQWAGAPAQSQILMPQPLLLYVNIT
jgi:hypothetical protein